MYISVEFLANPVANAPMTLLKLDINPNIESSHFNRWLKRLIEINAPETKTKNEIKSPDSKDSLTIF